MSENRYIKQYEEAEESGSKFENFTSPEGAASYCFLNVARDYKQDKKFRYKTDLVLTEDEATELVEFIDYLMPKSKAKTGARKLQDPPYKAHTAKNDDGEWEETGNTAIKFSVTKEVKTKKGDVWDRQPAFFDGEGNPIDPVAIGAGSRIVLSFQVYFWKNPSGAGVSLQPVAVQVIELVPVKGRERDAGGFGFQKREGAYKGAARGTSKPGPEPDDDEGDAPNDEGAEGPDF